MRKLVPMPSLSNVTPGATATLNLPVGLTYDVVSLEYSGKKANGADDVTVDDLQNIEVRINGKTVQTYKDGAELQKINDYYERPKNAGFLDLHFVRDELKVTRSKDGNVLPFASRLTGLGTADVQTLSIHYDVESTLTSINLKGHAIQSAAQPLGLITKVKSFPRSFATTGQQEIDNIPRSGARIAAIHLFKSDVSDVEVEINSVKMVDASKSLLEAVQKLGGRVPQTADATHIDFLTDGDLRHAMETTGVQDFRIRPTIDTIGEVRTVVEYLDSFGGI